MTTTLEALALATWMLSLAFVRHEVFDIFCIFVSVALLILLAAHLGRV